MLFKSLNSKIYFFFPAFLLFGLFALSHQAHAGEAQDYAQNTDILYEGDLTYQAYGMWATLHYDNTGGSSVQTVFVYACMGDTDDGAVQCVDLYYDVAPGASGLIPIGMNPGAKINAYNYAWVDVISGPSVTVKDIGIQRHKVEISSFTGPTSVATNSSFQLNWDTNHTQSLYLETTGGITCPNVVTNVTSASCTSGPSGNGTVKLTDIGVGRPAPFTIYNTLNITVGGAASGPSVVTHDCVGTTYQATISWNPTLPNSQAEIPHAQMAVFSASTDAGAAANTLDSDPNTKWFLDSDDQQIVLSLGGTYPVTGFQYSETWSRVKDYKVYVSTNTTNWGSAVFTGTMPPSNDSGVTFAAKSGNYLKFVIVNTYNGYAYASELNVYQTPSSSPPAYYEADISKDNFATWWKKSFSNSTFSVSNAPTGFLVNNSTGPIQLNVGQTYSARINDSITNSPVTTFSVPKCAAAGGTLQVSSNTATHWSIQGPSGPYDGAYPSTAGLYTSVIAGSYALAANTLANYAGPLILPSVSQTVSDSATTSYNIYYLGTPTNLTGNPGACGKIDLNWNDADPNVSGFTVWRSTTAGSSYAQVSANLAVKTYTDTPPVTGATYYYVVKSYLASPSMTSQSSEVSAIKLPCNASLSNSSESIYTVNNQVFVPQTSKIANNDKVTFKITISNNGSEGGVLSGIVSTLMNVNCTLANPCTATLDKNTGLGPQNISVTGTASNCTTTSPCTLTLGVAGTIPKLINWTVYLSTNAALSLSSTIIRNISAINCAGQSTGDDCSTSVSVSHLATGNATKSPQFREGP